MSENWTILWIMLTFLIICSIIIIIIQICLLRKLRVPFYSHAEKLFEHSQERLERMNDRFNRLEKQFAQYICEEHHSQMEIEKMHNCLNDLKYVQDYIQAAGSYIGLNTDQNKDHYSAMSADIYSHIPKEHWFIIENIDQAIRANDAPMAAERIKDLSRAFAETRKTVLSPYI